MCLLVIVLVIVEQFKNFVILISRYRYRDIVLQSFLHGADDEHGNLNIAIRNSERLSLNLEIPIITLYLDSRP